MARVPFRGSTRRGKQFNSMVQNNVDPTTGAARGAVFISGDDAARIGLVAGAPVTLISKDALLSDAIDTTSLEPDYNAVVRVESAKGN